MALVLLRQSVMSSYEELKKQARAVHESADSFDKSVVLPWYQDIVTLDPATVQARGGQVTLRFAMLQAQQRQLASGGDVVMGTLGSQLVTSAPAPPAARGSSGEPAAGVQLGELARELGAAEKRVNESRKLIGNVIGLQDFNKRAVLGHYRCFPTGSDPTHFIQTQVERARHAFGVIHGISAVCESAPQNLSQKTLNERDQQQIVALLEGVGTELEYQFVMTALQHLGWRDEVTMTSGTAKQRTKLQEQGAANRDGLIDDVPTDIIEQMQRDADELERLPTTDQLLASKIETILAKYRDPKQRDMFRRLLERRCYLDALISKCGTKAVREFAGRAYNEALDLRHGQNEIVGEMVRQLPGATCQFMAGVYDGMSHLPIIGSTMKDAANGFRELTGEVDELTGAWTGGTKIRNTIAHHTGFAVERIAEVAVTRDMGSAGALQTASGVKSAAGLAADGKDVYDTVMQLKGLYDNASAGWKLLWDVGPTLLHTVSDGIALCRGGGDVGPELFDMGIDLVSTGFDSLAGSVQQFFEGKYTVAGRVAAVKRETPIRRQPERAERRLPSALLEQVRRLRDLQTQQFAATTPERQKALAGEIAAQAEVIKEEYKQADKNRIAALGLKETREAKEREDKLRDTWDTDEKAIDPTSKADLKILAIQAEAGSQIWEVVKTLMIRGGVGMIKAVKDELISALKRWHRGDVDRKGRAGMNPDWSVVGTNCAKAGVAVVKSMVVPALETAVANKAMAILGRIIAKHHPEIAGLEELLRDPVSDLVRYGIEQIPIESWVTQEIPNWIGGLFQDSAAGSP